MLVVLFNTVKIIIWVTGPFVPKSFNTKSHVQIFYKLLLPLDNDQLMSENPKKMGGHPLVSEIKRIGNVVFLEALVM